MEVFGAALATLLSNVVSCVYLVVVMWKVSSSSPLSIRPADALKIEKPELRQLFSVGVPSAVLTGLFDVANIFLNSLMPGTTSANLSPWSLGSVPFATIVTIL